MVPPSPVEISHEKDGHQRQPHRFPVSWPPLPSHWIRCWFELVCGWVDWWIDGYGHVKSLKNRINLELIEIF